MKNMHSESKTNDYENPSHVARKKKAIATQFKKKNFREVVDLLNEEDEDLAKYYAADVK